MNSDLQSVCFTEIIQNSCNDTDELILQHLITMHFALKIVPWAQTYLLSLLIELRLRSSEKVNRPQEYPSWRFLTGSAFTNCAVPHRISNFLYQTKSLIVLLVYLDTTNFIITIKENVIVTS